MNFDKEIQQAIEEIRSDPDDLELYVILHDLMATAYRDGKREAFLAWNNMDQLPRTMEGYHE